MITTSYRATYELTTFANQVLGRIQSDRPHTLVAQPVARHGPAPHLEKCASPQLLSTRVAEVIADAYKAGSHSVAVICKTAAKTQKMAAALRPHLKKGNIEVALVENKTTILARSVAVLPVYLARGVEFDTVVLADADADTYGEWDADIRLFYLAVTRALHTLYVFCVGTRTPLLSQPES